MKVYIQIQTVPADLEEGGVFGTERLCLLRCRSILKLFRGVGIGLIDVVYVMNCSFVKGVDLELKQV